MVVETFDEMFEMENVKNKETSGMRQFCSAFQPYGELPVDDLQLHALLPTVDVQPSCEGRAGARNMGCHAPHDLVGGWRGKRCFNGDLLACRRHACGEGKGDGAVGGGSRARPAYRSGKPTQPPETRRMVWESA